MPRIKLNHPNYTGTIAGVAFVCSIAKKPELPVIWRRFQRVARVLAYEWEEIPDATDEEVLAEFEELTEKLSEADDKLKEAAEASTAQADKVAELEKKLDEARAVLAGCDAEVKTAVTARKQAEAKLGIIIPAYTEIIERPAREKANKEELARRAKAEAAEKKRRAAEKQAAAQAKQDQADVNAKLAAMRKEAFDRMEAENKAIRDREQAQSAEATDALVDQLATKVAEKLAATTEEKAPTKKPAAKKAPAKKKGT